MIRCFAVLYTCTALLFGFGHRMPAMPVQAPDIMAVLLAGGTLPAGCRETAPDRKGLHHAFICDACLVQQGAAPPSPPAALRAPEGIIGIACLSATAEVLAVARSALPPARGPPALA